MKQSTRVYVVDDDHSVLTAFRRLLETAGYDVVTSLSPNEFLDCHDHTIPGCVLLDIGMSELSGLETQQKMLELGVSRPIIRDALGRLRDQGIVYSRQGAGTFVQAAVSPQTHLAYSPVKTIADIQRCYEFRLTIEPPAAYFASQRRDAAAVDRLRMPSSS